MNEQYLVLIKPQKLSTKQELDDFLFNLRVYQEALQFNSVSTEVDDLYINA